MKRSTKAVLAALLVSFSAGTLISCSNDKKPQPQGPTTQEGEQGGQGNQQQEQGYVEKEFTATQTKKFKLNKFDADGNPVMVPLIQNGNQVINPQTGKPVMVQATEMVEMTAVFKNNVANKTFSLVITPTENTTIQPFEYSGKYEFTNGVGYKFTFDGSKDLVYARYNAETKKHTIDYKVPFLEYGSGEIRLSWEDTAFTIDEQKLFLSQVVFGGGYFSKDGIVLTNPNKTEKGIGFGLKLHANGEFTFESNHIAELNQHGTYTFDKANKTVTLTLKDCDKTTDIKATSKFENGIMSFDFTFNYTNAKNEKLVLPVTMKYDTQYYGGNGLSGVTYPMGAEFQVNITFTKDATDPNKGDVLIDGTPVDPTKGALAGMNLWDSFDKKAKYTYDTNSNVYTVKYTDMKIGQNGQPEMEQVLDKDGKPVINPETGKPVMKPIMVEVVFTVSYDETTKTYNTKDFKLGAATGVISGANLGVNFK